MDFDRLILFPHPHPLFSYFTNPMNLYKPDHFRFRFSKEAVLSRSDITELETTKEVI